MRTISRVLMILMLGCLAGCGVEELSAGGIVELDPGKATPDFTVTLHQQFEKTGSSEANDSYQPQGVCDDYWEHKYVDEGCGSCMHTVPEPDRPGNMRRYYRRLCHGTSCGGCEPWIEAYNFCTDMCY